MPRKRLRPEPKRPNLAAKALGAKIFGLKVVTPKKGYTRKVKHKTALPGDRSAAPADDNGGD